MTSFNSNSSSSPVVGFWSYVRDDDQAEGGRIRRLAQRIRAEYALVTGNDITVFVDKEDINWGDEWQRRIDAALAGTAFFIPVVTPRYFQSEACRRELLTFAGHAESLGVTELLLPLLYVEVAELVEESPDVAVGLIAKTQYEDWRDLRLEDEASATYRRAVHRLAQRLADINSRLVDRIREAEDVSTAETDDFDEPGFLDTIAAFEAAAPELSVGLNEMTELLQRLGELAVNATGDMQRSDQIGGGAAGRIRVARKLARQLEPLSNRMLELGQRYSQHLVDVDAGILAMIRRIEEQELSPEEEKSACELLESLRVMTRSARDNSEKQQGLIAALAQTEQLSRDLRPALRRLRQGVKHITDGQMITDEWERRADAAQLDCA